MIQLAADDARRQALESEDVTMVTLIRIDFPAAGGGTQYYTESARDLVVNGNTYVANSDLRSATPPPPQQESARDLAEISWFDPVRPMVMTYRQRFIAAGWTGIRLQFDVAFLTGESNVLSLPLNVYRGRCIAVDSDNEDGVPVTVARFAGPLVRLDDAALILTSDAQQRQRDASDGSMRFAHVARDIQWGRKV